jgi:hypothetical protein
MSETEALALIRQYVSDSQDDARRSDASAVVRLLEDKSTAIATLNTHFSAFTGSDRVWLYSLAGYLLSEDPRAYAQFYVDRLEAEDDPACRKLVLMQQRHVR